jgi:hypothetical protein
LSPSNHCGRKPAHKVKSLLFKEGGYNHRMRWKRISFLLPLLLYAFAPPSRADDTDPCAFQSKEFYGTLGKPENAEASEHLTKCQAAAAEQKKAEFAATRDSWAASLDAMPSGGWVFLLVRPDGTYAVFGSHRHATREGNVVSIWLRYEFREARTDNRNTSFKSLVEREMFDCGRAASKSVSDTYYRENNLEGGGSPYVYDESKASWVPLIPGTEGDTLLDWVCKTIPRVQPRAQ